MVLKKPWIKTQSDKHSQTWQRGFHPKHKNWLPSMWVRILEEVPSVKRMFPGHNWQVHAPTRINKETINGGFKNFKTKSAALRFAKAYRGKH